MAELPTIDGYRVLEELGSGSVSSVYKAIEEALGRTVALKLLRSTIAPSSPFAIQLEREAHVLAQLCHPNIGLLYAFSKSEGRIYLVLEYVDGFSLARLLKKKPTFMPDSVAAIGAAVARGLAHAHERGIVHRDIKPANILLSRRGEVKVFDFGIARQSQPWPEASAPAPVRLEEVAAFGTPAYMSPEQILGELVDARGDIFSLGVVLYELLCGARPFERGDEADRRPAAHRIRREPPIPLHRRAPNVPVSLERVVMRAIQKLPTDRFQNAAAMAEELEKIVATRTGLRCERLAIEALAYAGLTGQSESSAASANIRKRAPVPLAIGGLATLGAAVFVSGALLQRGTHHESESADTRALELVPTSPGYLRVLATPWAEIWVDGKKVDVTPVARPIPLAPGTHYVSFVHPQAATEKRTIAVGSGEMHTIDVVMAVPQAVPKDEPNMQGPRADVEKKR